MKTILILFGALLFYSCGGGSGYIVSGKVQGLDGTLIIQNNKKNNVVIEKDGSFTFKVDDKSDYNIQMYREPCLQRCEIKNGKGKIQSKNVEDVEIICLVKSWDIDNDFFKNASFEKQSIYIRSVAMNDIGDVIVIWSVAYLQGSRYYKSEFRDGIWKHPSQNEYLGIGNFYVKGARVAINNSGDAIIIWKQDNGFGISTIYKMEYNLGIWTGASLLSDSVNTIDSSGPSFEIAMNDSDDIVVAWGSYNATSPGIYKQEKRGGIWSDPPTEKDRIGGGPTPYNSNIQVSMNKSGNTIISWMQDDDTSYSVRVVEYSQGKWGSSRAIKDLIPDNLSTVSDPHLVMNDNNDAIIFWRQFINSVDDKSNLYIAERHDGNWVISDPNKIFEPSFIYGGDVPRSISLSMSQTGDAIISWKASDDDYLWRSYISEKRNGKWDWPISKDNFFWESNVLTLPYTIMDSQGNTAITWHSVEGATSEFKLMNKQYNDGYWKSTKVLSSAQNSLATPSDLPTVAMRECRQVVLWNDPIDFVFGPIHLAHFH